MHTKLVVLAMIATACSSFDPVGTYSGVVSRSGNAMRQTTDVDAEGSLNANNSTANSSQDGVRVVVTRADETHLVLALGDFCQLRARMDPEPNEHSGQIEVTPAQLCHVEMENWNGDVPMHGTVNFGRENPRMLTVNVNGSARRGDPNRAGTESVSYTWTFTGTAPVE
jgi:hypothetical protein